MASAAVRPVLAAILAASLGLVIAPDDAPTHDRATISVVYHGGGIAVVDWTIDAPDFVAPDGVAVPARPAIRLVPAGWRAPDGSRAIRHVLVLAPKTSPPC
jgi:hypothetical protein